MNQQAFTLITMTALVAGLISVLVFAALRFAAAARDNKRHLSGAGMETALLSQALEDAITMLKAQERAMAARAEASERLSGQIVASLTAGLVVTDLEGRVQIVNPSSRRLLGLDDGPLEGTVSEVLGPASPLTAAIEECLRDRQPIVRRSLELADQRTDVTHLGVTVSPLVSESGESNGVICLFTDLTAVVDLEEQLRLKDTLARLGELTAGLAHEFRNGLATVHGYARLLNLEALPAQERKYLEGLRAETEALGQVVTNFLSFARPTQLAVTPIDLGQVEPAVAPVVLDGDTLFSVRGISSFPAERRAGRIAEAIREVAADRTVPVESLALAETPLGTILTAGGKRVLALVDADAALEGVSRGVLAEAYRQRIAEAVTEYRREREPAVLWRNAGRAALATLGLVIVLWLASRTLRRLRGALDRRYRARISDVHIHSFEIVRAEQLWHALHRGISVTAGVVALVVVYIYLNYVLLLFPWTRGLGRNLLAIMLRPLVTLGNGSGGFSAGPGVPRGPRHHHPVAPEAGQALFPPGGGRQHHDGRLRRRVGDTHRADSPPSVDRLCPGGRLSLHPRLRIGGVQGDLAHARPGLLAGIVLGDQQRGGRPESRVSAGVQGGRPGEDRRAHRRGDATSGC